MVSQTGKDHSGRQTLPALVSPGVRLLRGESRAGEER